MFLLARPIDSETSEVALFKLWAVGVNSVRRWVGCNERDMW